MEANSLLTVEEAAKQLRVSPDTIRRLLRDKKLRGVRVGGQWRIPNDAIEAVYLPLRAIRPVQITKEMLGIQTRKSLLYLDQNFLSSAYSGKDPRWDAAMRRINELLDLQLLAVPYSSTHEEETQFLGERGDELLTFIRSAARGHSFEPYYHVERTQVVRAFQAYMANAPASYVREERDAVPSQVHDWDGPFIVSVHRAASAVERKRGLKQRGVEELVRTLSDWKTSANIFEQDVEREIRDSARILIENHGKKAARVWAGDFSALHDSPVNAEIVEDMLYILQLKGAPEPATVIGSFFKSEHFAEVPSEQLFARLFSAFKKRVREGAYRNPEKARKNLSGFFYDVQHAATYAPYCDAFFTDRFMADLLDDVNVAVERTFGCKVFSAGKWREFLAWLDDVESHMTAEHADGLRWAYPEYRQNA